MGDQTSKSRRRPVDALFGDNEAASLPPYMVEPPQPLTTVSPPSPAQPVRPEPEEPSLDVPDYASEPAIAPTYPTYSPPASLEPAAASPVTPSPDSTYTGFPTSYTPTYERPAASEQDEDFAYLRATIRQLYEEVSTKLYDSPTVTDYCMKMLMQAREAYIKKDFASAEFYVESVIAKLKRSEQSSKSTSSPKVWLLWFWELVMLVTGIGLIAVTYIPGLTLFGIVVTPELIVMLRAIGWGGIGGVIGALYNMPWFVQFREYDPAYNMNYFARPLQGLLIGAVLFLLSQAGVLAGASVIPGLAATSEPGEAPVGPVFLYVLAALAGFKQEYVYEFLDSVLKMVFRVPQVPKELKVTSAPKSEK